MLAKRCVNDQAYGGFRAWLTIMTPDSSADDGRMSKRANILAGHADSRMSRSTQAVRPSEVIGETT